MRILRLVLGVLLWMLVLILTMILVSTGLLKSVVASSAWLSTGTMTQAAMLAVSVALMLGLSKGKLGEYGFRMPTTAQFKSAFVFGSIVAVAVQVVLAVMWRLLPTSGGHPGVAGSSFLQIVITVWVIASICEEVFLRGLIQGFLMPLKDLGKTLFGLRLSLPVITAALLFGAMHIMLLTMGADGSLVTGIVVSATVLGLVAGYYRERTGSLIPAILIHMLFNVYSGLSQYIQELVANWARI